VMIRHRGLMNLVSWHQRTYRVRERDRSTQIAPIGFDASVWEMWPPLVSGASLHIASSITRSSPAETAAWLEREKITLCFLATPLAEAVLPLLAERSSAVELSLRALLTGGDKLGRAPEKTVPFEFVNHYGPTEATVVATYTSVKAGGKGLPPIGVPISNFQAFALDERLQLLPAGVPGTLYIGGEGLARGYLNRPELTAERFVPNPFATEPGARLYCTGDRVRFLHNGQLEFLGRNDQQVKIRGHRIEPGEIEAALREHPAVRSAVAIVDEEAGGGKRLAAYVVPRNDTRPEAADLRAHLRDRLPRHAVPEALGVVDSLPLTSNGKVDQRALPRLERTAPKVTAAAAPQSGLEQSIAGIWQRVLRLDSIGVNENFFDLGGHSLLAVEVRTELERVVNREIPMVDLFTHSTIRSLAKHLGHKTAPLVAADDMQMRANRRRQYLHNRTQSVRKQTN
jgi:acyl-coenzyme A synthetase/AMP-(fatty) acid ligase/acyl carrier protein